MLELQITDWSGVCNIAGKQILGLGNDIYQIGIALMEGVEKDAAKVTFNEADIRRKSKGNIDGIIDLFPSLENGVLIRDGQITDVARAKPISRHWQMAEYSSSALRNCLITYFKPYILGYLDNSKIYKDVLVIHLRGGDALGEWTQNTWRPSPLSYDFYKDAIARSGLENILIVTTPPENGEMHPAVRRIQQDYGADIQHGSILEDFSTLMNCTNLILDFSTFGYTAALMNTNLQHVFISRFVDKNGIPLLEDINGDVGFTMPKIENCRVIPRVDLSLSFESFRIGVSRPVLNRRQRRPGSCRQPRERCARNFNPWHFRACALAWTPNCPYFSGSRNLYLTRLTRVGPLAGRIPASTPSFVDRTGCRVLMLRSTTLEGKE